MENPLGFSIILATVADLTRVHMPVGKRRPVDMPGWRLVNAVASELKYEKARILLGNSTRSNKTILL